MKTLDKAATIEMLRHLKPGDVFYHPTHGSMTVSRIVGWEGGWHIDDDRQLKDIGDMFIVTAFRKGRQRAERVVMLPPQEVAT